MLLLLLLMSWSSIRVVGEDVKTVVAEVAVSRLGSCSCRKARGSPLGVFCKVAALHGAKIIAGSVESRLKLGDYDHVDRS